MEIAEWLKPYLNTECPYCKSPIMNNDNLTDRWCSNPNCPGHMSYKISALAARFGIKGVGPATALELIDTFHLPYHISYLPIFMAEKPRLYLWQVGEIAMIKGYQRQWRDFAEGCDTMEQVCQKRTVPAVIKEQLPLLQACEQACEVIPRLTGIKVNVMLSGSFDGYAARRDWVTAMNKKYGKYFEVIDVGTRKLDVQYLVKEEWATDHNKSDIAKEYGIPIVTPAKMEEILATGMAYIYRGGAT